MDHVPYGWKNAGTNCSHTYLGAVVMRQLGRWHQSPATILDIGCGNGYLTAEVARLGHRVIGCDPSADGIEVAGRAFPEVRFELISVYDEDLPARVGEPVDTVIALEVVEHLFFPRKLFEQAYRLIRPGGRLLISTPYHGYLKNLALSLTGRWDSHFGVSWDGGHIKFFSPRTLAALANEAGFREVEWVGAGRFPFFWKSIVLTAVRP